jgi:hypothetical protein
MTTISQTIPSLGSPPLTSDPTNFDTRADTLYGTSLPAFIAATNTWAAQANALTSELTVAGTLSETQDTSATSNSIGTGSKTFTVTAGKSWVVGMWLLVADTAAPSANYMVGAVTSYSSTTLTINVSLIAGSGTKTAWTISQTVALGIIPFTRGGTGLATLGTAGQVLAVNGGATALEYVNPPSFSIQAIASGALGNGDTVVINADGTVSVVSPAEAGSPVVFEAANTSTTSAAFDSVNGKVVIAYRDIGNSNQGTAIVGTVSGTTISFGTAVVFETGAISNSTTATVYDITSGKVVIAYRDQDDSFHGKAVVGTVSGTGISFGSPVTFEAATTTTIAATYDITNSKVVIAYRDVSNLDYGTAIVGTVSGTSISFGTAVVFQSKSTANISATYDSTNSKVVIAYNDDGDTTNGRARVGTVSGTGISFGTEVVFQTGGIGETASTYDSTSNRVVIIYRDITTGGHGKAIVGTISGTNISFGTAVVFEAASTSSVSASYDTGRNKVVIAYRDVGNSNYGTIIVGTVSGTSISFVAPIVFESAATSATAAIYDSTNRKVVIAYSDEGNSGHGTSVVFKNGNLTSENFIGISSAAYSNAATATIQTVGSTDDAQSGLTAGQAYYVQLDGSLGLTPATPSVFAGTAISATKLIIKG